MAGFLIFCAAVFGSPALAASLTCYAGSGTDVACDWDATGSADPNYGVFDETAATWAIDDTAAETGTVTLTGFCDTYSKELTATLYGGRTGAANALDGPSLRYTCPAAPTCGNGSFDASEQCDDSNTTNGDGCSDVCLFEPGYFCGGLPSICSVISATDSQSLSLATLADASRAQLYLFGVLGALAVFSAAAFWGWRLIKGNPKD